MKIITNSPDIKRWMTVEEAEQLPHFLKGLKECFDSKTPDFTSEANAVASLFDASEVIKTESAEVCRNPLAYGRILDGSSFDVWIKIIAGSFDTIYRIGFYLTDAWDISADNKEAIKRGMYVRTYKEV